MCVILLGLLLFVGYSDSQDIAWCSVGNKTTLSFTPYKDAVVGRYLAEWCINLNPKSPPAQKWELQLQYFNDTSHCVDPPKSPIYKQGKSHTIYIEDIEVAGNCSHVCLNTTIDLIFNACYEMKTKFLDEDHERNITKSFFHIVSNYSREQFEKNKPAAEIRPHDSENLTLIWHTGVPFESYDLFLAKRTLSHLDPDGDFRLRAVDVTEKCYDITQLELACRLCLSPGDYDAQLTLHAPWFQGTFRDQSHFSFEFTVSPPKAAPLVEAAPAWPWAVAAFVAVVVLGAVTCYVCRSLDARALHKRIWKIWIKEMNESRESNEPVVTVVPPKRHILLLYAREGALAANFYAALRDMLQEAPDTQVYDIYSPEVMSMAADAPTTWLRGMLQRSDVSVVLLQTLALAALHRQRLHDTDNSVKLQEPLLGRRFLYRAPQYGDTLLQYAVQLIGESVHARNDYIKYHVATLTESKVEMFPHLVPFRRFLLPGGADLLLRSLCGTSPSQDSLDALTVAAREFVDLTKDNPDYLMDELMTLS